MRLRTGRDCDCGLVGGSATLGLDYSGVGRTIVFDPGDTAETFTLTLTDGLRGRDRRDSATRACRPGNASLGDPSAATLTIIDNDGPAIGYQYANYVLDEGLGSASITVRLTASSPQIVSVGYSTGGGTAVRAPTTPPPVGHSLSCPERPASTSTCRC